MALTGKTPIATAATAATGNRPTPVATTAAVKPNLPMLAAALAAALANLSSSRAATLTVFSASLVDLRSSRNFLVRSLRVRAARPHEP